MTRIVDWWSRLSRGDRVAVLFGETLVVLLSVGLATLDATIDWKTAIVVGVFMFVFAQTVVVAVAWAITRRRRPRATRVPTKFEQRANTVLGWLFVIGLVYVYGGYAFEWLFPESEFGTKWRYGLEKSVPSDAEYVIGKHPHDCEFMSAPLGDKHCHYEKQVEILRVRDGTSGRELSYDGKTWSPADASARTTVFVSWQKIEE